MSVPPTFTHASPFMNLWISSDTLVAQTLAHKQNRRCFLAQQEWMCIVQQTCNPARQEHTCWWNPARWKVGGWTADGFLVISNYLGWPRGPIIYFWNELEKLSFFFLRIVQMRGLWIWIRACVLDSRTITQAMKHKWRFCDSMSWAIL